MLKPWQSGNSHLCFCLFDGIIVAVPSENLVAHSYQGVVVQFWAFNRWIIPLGEKWPVGDCLTTLSDESLLLTNYRGLILWSQRWSLTFPLGLFLTSEWWLRWDKQLVDIYGKLWYGSNRRQYASLHVDFFFHCDCEELMGVNLFGIFTGTAIYIFETLTEHNLQTCMPFI